MTDVEFRDLVSALRAAQKEFLAAVAQVSGGPLVNPGMIRRINS